MLSFWFTVPPGHCDSTIVLNCVTQIVIPIYFDKVSFIYITVTSLYWDTGSPIVHVYVIGVSFLWYIHTRILRHKVLHTSIVTPEHCDTWYTQPSILNIVPLEHYNVMCHILYFGVTFPLLHSDIVCPIWTWTYT